ncbi:hypothetical protein HN51_040183, partial [Arachis hypogaea]
MLQKSATFSQFPTHALSANGEHVGFHVNKILDLIFSLYVPKFQVDRLVALISFLCSPKSKFLFSASTSFTPCKPIAGTESSTSLLSMVVISCNAHRIIGLAGSVHFAVDGDGD